MSDSTSNAARPIHIKGDNNILVTAGDNSTVNITRPSAEIFEMSIRLDAHEERFRSYEERFRRMEEKLEKQQEESRKYQEESRKRQKEKEDLAIQHNTLLQIVAEKSPQLLELFLRNNLGRLDRISPGSVFLFVRFSRRKELENLWEMYETGELKAEMTKILDSDKSWGTAGNMDTQVYIDHKEYLRGIEVFKQQATTYDSAHQTLPMEEWSADMLKEVLLKEGVSEIIANRFHEEDIDGSVFVLYREDEFESDFKLIGLQNSVGKCSEP